MKTNLHDISSIKKKLVVEIEAEEIDKRINDAYRKFGKTAKIKGFRPGKIPRKILENYFGNQVLEDVTSSLINETLPKAIEEISVFPLGMPVIENAVLKSGQDYRYSAVMEVRPEIELSDYLGVEVEKEKFSITDESIERQLEEIRESIGTLESIDSDRSIKKGDYVIFDYTGYDGENAIEGIEAKDFSLKIGSNRFYPGFEDALLGCNKGQEKEITIDFKDDYFHSRLAGKQILFRVNIKDIKEVELPDLNDEFAKNLSGEFDTLEKLKEKIREDLTYREKRRIDDELKQRLIGKIADSVEFELPESLVRPEIDATFENIKQNLVRAGTDMGKSGLDESKLRDEIRPAAEKRVKTMLILGKIAELNGLKIEEKDLTTGFEQMAKGMGQSPETIRKYYEANNLIEAYIQTLLREKTLNYLVENAKVKEVDKVNIIETSE